MSLKSVTFGDIDDHPQIISIKDSKSFREHFSTYPCCSSEEGYSLLFIIASNVCHYLSSVLGRTGTAVCAWLIASGQFEEAQVEFSIHQKITQPYATVHLHNFNLYYLLLKSDGTRMETKVFRKPTVLTLADCYIFKAKYGLLPLRLFVENNDSSHTCPILYKCSFQ